jgi:SAM-dependent methyltransferase
MIEWLARLGHRVLPNRLTPDRPAGASAEQWALAGNPIPGDCPVCGTRRVRFSGFTENLRESGVCSRCGANNRQRQMAFALRRSLGLALAGRLTLPVGCRLYSAESNGPLHDVLKAIPDHACSEYWGEAHIPGTSINGVRHEDLERLSFADASFDVVLTSDVLEHVADAYRAHREIFRVLRPGGQHIFSVPFAMGAPHDDVRARRADGGIEYLAAKLYHGDPIRPDQGVLVWRIFGNEMLTRLQEIGFAVQTLQLSEPAHGIIGDNALVFVARRP